jgi:MFS family permease
MLVWTGLVNVWFIFLLSFVSGCGQAFGGPAYQALIPSLVPRRDLPNAIALNSTQFNLSRVLGPVAGGAVLATIGVAACFALNGISFFIVVIALAALHLPAHVPSTKPRALEQELRSGLYYVREQRIMMILTVLAFVTAFLSMPVATLMPTFAASFSPTGNAQQWLWVFMACQGLGAIVGALVVGSLGRMRHMGRALLVGQMLLGLFIASFAASRVLPLTIVLLFVSGICSMAVFSMSFSLLQLTVPDDLRGRVVSIYMVALRGGWPLGALVTGAIADVFSAPVVIGVNGIVLFSVALALLLRRSGTLHHA